MLARAPIVTVIDLPYPPSVNRLWRNNGTEATSRVYLSPSYRKWKAAADALVIANAGLRGAQRINGPFAAEIILNAGERAGDLDNRVKAVLDALQRYNLIRNDSGLRDLHVHYGEAPAGCRVTLRELPA